MEECPLFEKNLNENKANKVKQNRAVMRKYSDKNVSSCILICSIPENDLSKGKESTE